MFEDQGGVNNLEVDEIAGALRGLSCWNSGDEFVKITDKYGKKEVLERIISDPELFIYMIDLEKMPENFEKFRSGDIKNVITCFPEHKEQIELAYINYLLHNDKFLKHEFSETLKFLGVIYIFPKHEEALLDRVLSNSDVCLSVVDVMSDSYFMKFGIRKYPERLKLIKDKYFEALGNNVGLITINYFKDLVVQFPEYVKQIKPKFINFILCSSDEFFYSFLSYHKLDQKTLANLCVYDNFVRLVEVSPECKDSFLEKILLNPKLFPEIVFDNNGLKKMIENFPQHSKVFTFCYALTAAIKSKDSGIIKQIQNQLEAFVVGDTISREELQLSLGFLENSLKLITDHQSDFFKILDRLYVGLAKKIVLTPLDSYAKACLERQGMFAGNNIAQRIQARSIAPHSTLLGLSSSAPLVAAQEMQSKTEDMASNISNGPGQ